MSQRDEHHLSGIEFSIDAVETLADLARKSKDPSISDLAFRGEAMRVLEGFRMRVKDVPLRDGAALEFEGGDDFSQCAVAWWDALPDGLRWATGGGHVAGDPGLHVALENTRGSLCGRYTPDTTSATARSQVCGSCARILEARYGLRVRTRFNRG